MLKLKANAGIPAVNFLMVAAAVLGASYLAVKSFDTDLTTNLGTMTSNHLTSLAAVDTANAPSEPGAGGGAGGDAGGDAGAGAASSAVTNLSTNGFCRLSIVVPDGEGYVDESATIPECFVSINNGITGNFGNSPENLCASKEKNYIEVDTTVTNDQYYVWSLRHPETNGAPEIVIYSFTYSNFVGEQEEHMVENESYFSDPTLTNYACFSW